MSFRSNRTILEKADMALADLTLGGGMLKPAQAKKFMRLLIKESILMKLVTVVPMASPKQQIAKIKFGSRVLRPGAEYTSLTEAERAKPDFSMVELDAKLFKAEIRLSDEVLEDSIERGELRQTIMEMMAEAISRDIEEIVVNGDETSADSYLSVMNGVLAQSTSNVVDAVSQPITKELFLDNIKTLPSEHFRNKKSMKFFTSIDAEQNYRNSLAERPTVVGDKFLEKDTPVLYSGVPIQAIPMFPENQGVDNNHTSILFCNPKNIHVGILRKIRFESARDISEGTLKIVASLRFDVKYADEQAVVKTVNVRL